MNNVRVSVVIPTLNGARHLGEQLEALKAQDWDGDLQVIVADNSSTDETCSIAQEYAPYFPSFMIIDASDKRGAAHARNTGAAAATGAYILFLDQDDRVGDGWLNAMVAALGRHPFVAATMEHRQLNPDWTRAVYGEPQTDHLLDLPGFLPFAWGGTLGIHAPLHEQIGGFDESLTVGEDVDYCYRIQLRGIPLVLVPDAILHYRDRTSTRDIFRQFRRYSFEQVIIVSRYREYGIDRGSLLRGIASWILLIVRAPIYLHTHERRATWASHLAWKIGRLEGSVRYRILAP